MMKTSGGATFAETFEVKAGEAAVFVLSGGWWGSGLTYSPPTLYRRLERAAEAE